MVPAASLPSCSLRQASSSVGGGSMFPALGRRPMQAQASAAVSSAPPAASSLNPLVSDQLSLQLRVLRDSADIVKLQYQTSTAGAQGVSSMELHCDFDAPMFIKPEKKLEEVLSACQHQEFNDECEAFIRQSKQTDAVLSTSANSECDEHGLKEDSDVTVCLAGYSGRACAASRPCARIGRVRSSSRVNVIAHPI